MVLVTRQLQGLLAAVFVLIPFVLAEEYEYYYDDESSEKKPDDVIGFLLSEKNKKDTVASENDEDVGSTSNFLSQLQEKIFVDPGSGLADDPVFNWILTFSAIALFFQAFYTPFAKTSIGRKKRNAGDSNDPLRLKTVTKYEKTHIFDLP